MAEISPPPNIKSPPLSVPIVIWGPKPPENQICALRVFPDGETIITGAENGHLTVWKCTENLTPLQLMIGHSSKITAVSQTSNTINNTRFVSTSADGHICLWELLDGRCIDSTTSIQIHRHIEPYTYKSSRHTRATRLFCLGDYCDVQVMDPQDLTIVFIISSRVEPDWVSCYTFVNRGGKDQLVGVTMSGMMKFWTLHELEKKDPNNPLYEDESKRFDLQHVKKVSFNEANQRLLLIVASSSWMVIDLEDLSTIVWQKNDNDIVRCNAGFVLDIDKVGIGYSDESIKVYQLPITSLKGDQITTYFKNVVPTENYFEQPGAFVVGMIPGLDNPSKAWPNDSNYVCYIGKNSENPESSQRNVYFVRTGRSDGTVFVWKMPPFDQQFMKAVPSIRNLPFKFKGTYRESLESIWKTLNDREDNSVPVLNSDQVCCSLFVSSQGKLFLGRSDGVIIMTYACETLSRQWLRVPAERPNTRRLLGHKAAVRSMYYPYEHDTRYDPQIFVSGSNDFSVVIWNINNGMKIHRFVVNGGPVTSFMIPPSNCNKQVTKCIAALSSDNSVALLNIRDNKCTLLASRHPHPVVQVKWRPLDDFMMVKLSDGSVYIWQMETANLDRIVTGLLSDDVMAACDEQIGLEEGTDETSAHQAVQFMRALKHKNIDAVKQKVVGGPSGAQTPGHYNENLSNAGTSVQLGSPMTVMPLPGCIQGAHMVQFEVSSLIAGILHIDAAAETHNAQKDSSDHNTVHHLSKKLTWQFEANLYLDVARLMLSMLHAWDLDDDLDEVCEKRLSLHKPRHQVYFGNVSRGGELAVGLPTRFATDFDSFSKQTRWQSSHSLNTNHLLAIISTANTLMAMKNATLQLTRSRKSIAAPNPLDLKNDGISSEAVDKQQIKQGWSLVAALHCVLLPDHVRPRSSYAAPSIEMLVRRWQDSCLEVREAAQALLIRELSRLGSDGRRRLIESWAPFLPPLLDDSLSIFGSKLQSSIPTVTPTTSAPPIPPRTKTSPPKVAPLSVSEPPTAEGGEAGIQQVRRNQATAIILLGVIGAEFGDELNRADLTRATAVSLLELLVAAPSNLIPVHSPLRRAAIDLLGRGFVHWEPHLEISKVVLGLLDLAANNENKIEQVAKIVGAPLNAIEDAGRTARQSLSLIALARPPALITALSMEVARYNSAAQHQTIQHTVVSPLLKSKVEVLRIIEELCDKRYGDIISMMLPVGDVLVHCLDVSLLKNKALSDIFKPITRFNMVGYCSSTRRIAFGGHNGTCVVHELRATKTHSLPSHNGPITSVAFSEDGKFLATYGAQEGKMNFFQTSQTFLGMGQNQMKLTKSQPAPTVSVPMTPSDSSFRPRLVWINSKSLTLMLPEGREQRFSV